MLDYISTSIGGGETLGASVQRVGDNLEPRYDELEGYSNAELGIGGLARTLSCDDTRARTLQQ